jgi:Raf kinase inhibitor-like YbhB/YbcL family protein
MSRNIHRRLSMLSTADTAKSVSVRAPDVPHPPVLLEVRSTSFSEGGPIPMEHVYTGCGGKNVSPQVSWSGAPAGTKSFVVTCFDPDAPTGSGYWHWAVFNIPASVASLEAGDTKLGGGKSGRNDYGETGYGGPCPPKGDGQHRYIYRVYALDVESIGASEGTTGASVTFMTRGHVLATGAVTGKFGH